MVCPIFPHLKRTNMVQQLLEDKRFSAQTLSMSLCSLPLACRAGTT